MKTSNEIEVNIIDDFLIKKIIVKNLEKKYKISGQTIYAIFRRNKIDYRQDRHKKFTEQEKQNIILHFKKTKSITKTFKNFHTSLIKVKQILNENNIPILHILKNHKSWKGHEEISGQYFTQIKKCAKDRGLEFLVTIEQLWDLFLKQNRKCALSGIELKFKSNSKLYDGTASVDRIDSSKNYTIDNVQWIHKDINKIKGSFTDEKLKYYCDLISNYKKEK